MFKTAVTPSKLDKYAVYIVSTQITILIINVAIDFKNVSRTSRNLERSLCPQG